MAPPKDKDDDSTLPPTASPDIITASSPSSFPPPKLPVDRRWLHKLLKRHHPTSPQTNMTAYVLAPMVDQSDLPFRLQTRRYGTNLCVTPMVHAKLFATAPHYREKFRIMALAADRPLIVQICGSDPAHTLYTCQALEPLCDGIDINCGCPQQIAKRGVYGAFLLERETVLLDCVKHLLAHLTVPLSVKVRLLPSPDDTSTTVLTNTSIPEQRQTRLDRSLHLYTQLVDAGIHMLTIHGRTRYHKGVATGRCDWDALRTVVDKLGDRIPILANGSLGSVEEIRECLKHTKCDGVMSSEAILEYPALFDGLVAQDDAMAIAATTGATIPPLPPRRGRLDLALEYLELARQYPTNVNGQGSGLKCMRVHVHRFLHKLLQEHTDVRMMLSRANKWEELHEAVLVLRHRLADVTDPATEELSWYMRHRNKVVVGDTDPAETPTALFLRMERERAVKHAPVDVTDCLTGLFDGDDE